jgi:S-adenosylmethionine-diacylglycerol 3-amino-3-carboxypropyl transferase
MDKQQINYSQCWEDPQVLVEALSIHPADRILSVTSGGDNTLALLLAGAGNVISVDLNPIQNYALEVKKTAPKYLTYKEYLELMGVTKSKSRQKLFENMRAGLSAAADAWLSTHRHVIDQGLIHAGRFERFTLFFAHKVLPFIHSKQTIANFLACHTPEEQQAFYKNHWDSWMWRLSFGLASSRLMLKRFARQKQMFSHTEGQTAAEVYRARLERHLTSVPMQGNYFLHYSLTGGYGMELPPYLEEKGYEKLRHMPESALTITTDTLLHYLRAMPADSFSKFNLSDIFEALSPDDNDALWEEIIRTAKSGAVVAYWNNLVQRSFPIKYSSIIKTDEDHLRSLRAKDRVFFYDNFYVHTIIK